MSTIPSCTLKRIGSSIFMISINKIRHLNFASGIQLVNLESISDRVISDSFEIDVEDFWLYRKSDEFNFGYSNTIHQWEFWSWLNLWDFGDGNGLQFNQNQVNEITYDQSLNGSSIDVALVITNDIGCRDTSSYTYEIKEAFLDLALQTLFVQDINGYLTVGVGLSILGSVEDADLYLKSAENMFWRIGRTGWNESEIYISMPIHLLLLGPRWYRTIYLCWR